MGPRTTPTFSEPISDPIAESFKNPATNKHIINSLKNAGLPNGLLKNVNSWWTPGSIGIKIGEYPLTILEKGTHYTVNKNKGQNGSDIIITPRGIENLTNMIHALKDKIDPKDWQRYNDEIAKIEETTHLAILNLQTDIQSA